MAYATTTTNVVLGLPIEHRIDYVKTGEFGILRSSNYPNSLIALDRNDFKVLISDFSDTDSVTIKIAKEGDTTTIRAIAGSGVENTVIYNKNLALNDLPITIGGTSNTTASQKYPCSMHVDYFKFK